MYRCASVLFRNTLRCVSVVISNTNESLTSVSIESCKNVSVFLTCRMCAYSVKGSCEIVVNKTYDSKSD